MSTPKFTLPPIHDTPESPWGPPPLSSLPSSLTDVPYAPYSKSDKLGRFADWNASPLPAAPQQQTKRTQAYGTGTASAFAYFHAEDEASFSLVDNTAGKSAVVGRGRGGGRGGARGGAGRGGRGGQVQQGRGGAQGRGGGRRNWRDWEKNNRSRESSVVISPNWDLKEEIEFHRLAKLRLDVDEPEDMFVLLFVICYFSDSFTATRMAGCTNTINHTIG